MAKSVQFTTGDEIVLFTEFPFDYETDLPIRPSDGLILSEPPYTALQTPDNDHMPCYVLPGTKLPGMGMCHCCLMSPASYAVPRAATRRGLLFSFIAALRLTAPARIVVGGHFTHGDSDNLIKDATLLNLRSTWQPRPYRYTGADVIRAGEVFERMNECMVSGPSRLRNAAVLFTQVTNGYSFSYQMSVMGMYSALESLFAPSSGDTTYAKTLGKRIANYLASYARDISLSDWIEKHYRDQRHSLSHGSWEMSPDEQIAQKKRKDFGILHETLRLSILGFLSTSNDDLAFLSKSGPPLKCGLDSLPPAQGALLKNQTMWLE